jgi:hypothetical protein
MNAPRKSNRCHLEKAKASIQEGVALLGGKVVPSKAGTPLTVEQWAERINAPLRRSVEGLIQAGLEFISAKEELDHGEWMELFNRKLVKTNPREVERLMQVARNEVLANPTNWSNLPGSLQALCALSPVKPTVLTEAITAGVVAPCMTIKQAKQFRSNHETKRRKKTPPIPGAENQPGSQTAVVPGGFGRQDKVEFRISPIAVKWEGAINSPPELSKLVDETIFDALKRLEPLPVHLCIGQGQQKDEIQVSLKLELCDKKLVTVRSLSVLEIVADALSRGFAAYPPELRAKFREQVLLMVGALDPRHDITPAFLLRCVKWFSGEKGSHPS